LSDAEPDKFTASNSRHVVTYMTRPGRDDVTSWYFLETHQTTV